MQDIIIDHCIICGNTDTREVFNIKDHLVTGEYFKLHECTNCHFRFVQDPPPSSQAGRYYDTEEYVEHSDSSSGVINFIYHRARKWMLNFKFRLLDQMKKPKSILDFGTGTGYFLNYMKSRGYDGTGIEISTKARQFGRESFGLNIYEPSYIFSDNIPSNFGYITFWHVLEHVYNVENVLKKVKDLLADEGCLIVALPNYNCLEEKIYGKFWNGYDIPRHLWHFSYDNFVDFAKNNGFRLVKSRILPLDPFYNGLISESYRKKKWAHILIPFTGFASLLAGWLNHRKASSVVYFLEKEQ